MMGRTHVAGGVALGYIALNNIGIFNVDLTDKNNLIIVTTGLILGSLLPDIDHPRSFISLKVKPIGFLISRMFKHREYTHSIVGATTMTLLFYLILRYFNINKDTNLLFTISLTIGVISHIILDMLTYSGVALLYPFTKKRIRLLVNYYVPTSFRLGGIESLLGALFSIGAYVLLMRFIVV